MQTCAAFFFIRMTVDVEGCELTPPAQTPLHSARVNIRYMDTLGAFRSQLSDENLRNFISCRGGFQAFEGANELPENCEYS
jgi:hypothetical protein